jgi:hypothetical protein
MYAILICKLKIDLGTGLRKLEGSPGYVAGGKGPM